MKSMDSSESRLLEGCESGPCAGCVFGSVAAWRGSVFSHFSTHQAQLRPTKDQQTSHQNELDSADHGGPFGQLGWSFVNSGDGFFDVRLSLFSAPCTSDATCITADPTPSASQTLVFVVFRIGTANLLCCIGFAAYSKIPPDATATQNTRCLPRQTME